MKILSATVAILLVVTGTGWAADTVETWAVGATDFELYFGAENLGLPREDGGIFGDVVLGYGLLDLLSAYLGTTLSADRFLDRGAAEHHLGLFATPLNGAAVDLDLFLGLSGGDGLAVSTGFEINWDDTPDMSTWGLYLRGGIVLENEPAAGGEGPGIGEVLELNPGVYWTLSPRAQVLVEYSTGYLPGAAAEADDWQDGHFHLGYNRLLTDSLELISEVSLAADKVGADRPWGAFVGLIATVPAGP